MVSSQNFRVESFVASKAIKAPVLVETNAAITLSGLQTVNGVALDEGDRALVKDQTDAIENGIYEANTSAWERAPDWDGIRDAGNGTLVIVARTAAVALWQMTTASDPFTPGTDACTFSVLTGVDTLARLASVLTGDGASLVGVEDSAGNFDTATVEAVLAEIIADYAAVTTGNGASKVGVEDSAGHFTAANVEAVLAELASSLGGEIKAKTADESVNNSVTPQDDNHLTGFTVEPNSRYAITGFLDYDQNGGDLRIALSFSVAVDRRHYQLQAVAEDGTTDTDTDNAGLELVIDGLTDAQNASVLISGMVQFGAVSSGTGKLTWAQGTSNANATTLKEGSWLKFEKVP
jgi:hypothetical protein